jgi:hypothetical protein
MNEWGGVLAALWLLVGCLHIVINRDAVSPGKFYHAYLGLFFLALLDGTHRPEVYWTYFCLLVTSGFAAVLEGVARLRSPVLETSPVPRAQRTHALIVGLWLASIVPVLAQIYLVQSFGGLVGYLNVIGLRVREFQGLNHIILVIKLIFPFNLLYFCYVLFDGRHGARWRLYAPFLGHCLLTTAIGLMSGSRSLALVNIVWMIAIYNYVRRPISVRFAVSGAVAMIAIALALGAARNNLRWTDAGLQSSAFQQSTESFAATLTGSGTAKTGTEPLDLVFAQGVADPKLGTTFVTGFTNLVPRGLWPGKPESGGLVLTREYTGDAWGGASNLSTGLVAESMLNFGLAPGLVVGLALLIFLLTAISFAYARLLQCAATMTIAASPWVITYIYALQFVTGNLVGEFANGVVVLITQCVGLWAVWVFTNVVARHIALPRGPRPITE